MRHLSKYVPQNSVAPHASRLFETLNTFLDIENGSCCIPVRCLRPSYFLGLNGLFMAFIFVTRKNARKRLTPIKVIFAVDRI